MEGVSVMKIRVLFFGQLKDVVGRSTEELDLPTGASAGTVFDRYASEYPRLTEMASSVAIACNQEFADRDRELGDGDEVALMPPVSGGSNGGGWLQYTRDEAGFYGVTDDPIDMEELIERVQEDSDGAVLTFLGVVRDNTGGRKTLYLDYEGYVPLAVKTMQEIANDLKANHDIHAVAIAHRVGRLEIKEASVGIVVTSAHRQAAYDASLEAINRIKKRAPIWKKEYFEDGDVWVEGGWEDGVPRSGTSE